MGATRGGARAAEVVWGIDGGARADKTRYELGMRMPTADWLELNSRLVFEHPDLRRYVAPFPPSELMQIVSGLTSEVDFAAHGATIYRAIDDASPRPLSEYQRILDFGCGCGRLARLLQGHPGAVAGCDIDGRLVDWVNDNLTFMDAARTQPNAPLPFEDGTFDAVISISVFTHLNEESQRFYLGELSRVARSGAYLFLTTHGERALERAQSEPQILQMLAISEEELWDAAAGMSGGLHHFVLQRTGHLTSSSYEYGIAFVPDFYVRTVWSAIFEIVEIVPGAIHDFQDLVVSRKR